MGRYNERYNALGELVREDSIMRTLKVTTVGNSAGVVLPKEILDRLRIEKGAVLYVLDTPGGIELTPYDPNFAKQMSLAEKVMREDRDVLRKLAE